MGLITLIALGLAGTLAGCADSSVVRPLSGVLITLDTTRADALSCCGAPQGVTPALDRLAREGVVYENARSVAPITLPAHASMLTGLYPGRHSVRDNSLSALPEAALTLAERARAEGVPTGAFVAAGVLDPAFGLDQGFQVYEAPARGARAPRHLSTHYAERPAREVVDSARRWLRALDPVEPFLLWIHLFEPHAPYQPTPAALAQAGGDPYRGEVSLADEAVGVLLAELEAQGRLAEVLIVVVGDHGEGLGEHGEDTHGVFCYDTTLRVPFIVRYPDGYRAGERSREIVSVADVYPTLVEAMQLGQPGPVDGLSLYRRRVPPERGVYFESFYGYLHYGWAPLVGWIDARGKYIHGATPEYFETSADLGELEELGEGRAAELKPYREAIARVVDAPGLQAEGEIEPELLEQLAALGYATARRAVTTLPDPLEPTELPDPRTRKDELARIYRALERAEQGGLAEAIELLSAVVSENPRNPSARQYLADYLVAAGECPRAVPLLESLVAVGAERASTHLNLGFCLAQDDRNEEAVAHFKRALELDAGSAAALRNLVVVLKRLDRLAEAEEYLRLYEALRAR